MIQGELTNLRPIRKSDLKYIKSWINDREVQFYSQEEYPIYFNNLVIRHIYGEGIKGERRIYMIEDKKGSVIGELWLYPIDIPQKVTELVIIIGRRENRDRGCGKDAIKTIARYCFKELNLEFIRLKVFSFNQRAIKCYRACGFEIIGRSSRKVIRYGVRYDELVMELRKNQFNDVNNI